MKKIIYILPGAFLLRFKKNESLLKFPSIISMLNTDESPNDFGKNH